MKQELEDFNDWLTKNKDVDLKYYIDEYLYQYIRPSITIKDVVKYSAMLCIVKPEELYTAPKTIKERITNRHALARGFVVKYVLEKNVSSITTSNVFQKIFGFPKDHSTAIYWRDQDFKLDDLRIYKLLCKHLDGKDIIWQ